jgi:hypothetical protein
MLGKCVQEDHGYYKKGIKNVFWEHVLLNAEIQFL